MSAYAVDPEALRAAAAAVERLVGEAQTNAGDGCADVGHDDLAMAISEFEQDASSSWTTRRQTTEAIGRGLDQTANIFENADEDAADSAKRVNPGMF